MMPEPAWRIMKWQGHGRDPALLSVTGPMRVVIWSFGRLMLACLVQLIAYRSSNECAARRSGFQPFAMALRWPWIRLLLARPEDRILGNEWVSTGRSRGSPYPSNTTITNLGGALFIHTKN